MSLTRYLVRQLPVGVLGVTGGVGVAWAITTDLETTLERTVLAALTTVGLSLAVVDAAHALTAAVSTSLRIRRTLRILLAVGLAFALWTMSGAAAGHLGRWEILQWLVIAGSQIATGTVIASLRPSDPGLLAGAFMAAIWCACTAGRAHALLYEVGEHRLTWLAAGIGFVAIATRWGRDPAARRRSSR